MRLCGFLDANPSRSPYRCWRELIQLSPAVPLQTLTSSVISVRVPRFFQSSCSAARHAVGPNTRGRTTIVVAGNQLLRRAIALRTRQAQGCAGFSFHTYPSRPGLLDAAECKRNPLCTESSQECRYFVAMQLLGCACLIVRLAVGR